MSAAYNSGLARRPLLKGLVGIAGLIVAAAAAFELPRVLGPHYRPTPFDDLLALLPDRESAARLGEVATSQNRFRSAGLVQDLRARLGGHSLVPALDADLAQSRLIEVRGWVLPETLVLLCALAARAD